MFRNEFRHIFRISDQIMGKFYYKDKINFKDLAKEFSIAVGVELSKNSFIQKLLTHTVRTF